MSHFLRYLGIFWFLNPRKYGGVEGSIRQRILSSISSNTLLLLLLLVSMRSLFYGARVGGDRLGISICYTVISNSLSLVQFYLDGFLWVFWSPLVRSSVSPYPKPRSHLAVT